MTVPVSALAVWMPYLVWQAAHGWPQLELAAAIAAGSSGTSEPRWAFLPFQLVLVSPLLVPVWAAGLWRLARDPGPRAFRALAVAYPVGRSRSSSASATSVTSIRALPQVLIRAVWVPG